MHTSTPFYMYLQFRFADKLDVFLMIAGSIAMAGIGVAIPTNLYFFGDLMTKLVVFDMSNRAAAAGFLNMSSANWTTPTDITVSQCQLEKIQK